jgi:hypothetical protein
MRSTLSRAIVTLIALFVLSPDADAQVSAEQASNVRLISTTGAVREGRLLDLTASEVVLLQDGLTLTLPLNEVQRIERASHGIRRGALTGAIGGFALGMALSCVSSGDDTGCWPPFGGALLAGIGAGLGVAVGALHDAARRGSDVIYTAPGQGTTIDLPKVAFAAGGGVVVRRHATSVAVPALQGSVQFPVSPRTSLEVEAMQWSWHRTREIGAVADEAWRTLSLRQQRLVAHRHGEDRRHDHPGCRRAAQHAQSVGVHSGVRGAP